MIRPAGAPWFSVRHGVGPRKRAIDPGPCARSSGGPDVVPAVGTQGSQYLIVSKVDGGKGRRGLPPEVPLHRSVVSPSKTDLRMLLCMRAARPPEQFVLVTPTRWSEFARALGLSRRLFQLRCENQLVGWRNAATRFVDPAAYKGVLGTWPDGYWLE